MKFRFFSNPISKIAIFAAVLLSTASVFTQSRADLSTKTEPTASDTEKTTLQASVNPRGEREGTTTENLKTDPPGKDVFAAATGKDYPKGLRTTYFSERSDTGDANPKKLRQASSSDWQFSFAPYLFAAGISGTVGAQGRTAEIDLSIGDVLSNFDIGLMGTFEAKKGKFIFLNDLVWTKLSSERETPGELFSTAKIGVNLFIFDPEVGYRLVESEKGTFDVLGGVRIWSVENNLNFTTGILPGFDVSARKTWAAPVVGVRGNVNLSPKFFLVGKFDIGGAGIGADLTTQFFGGAGYRVTKKIALIGGYRYLQVDYDDSEGFLFDTKMSGLMFGAKFNF